MTKNVVVAAYIKQFEYYRSLGEKAMSQIEDESLHWRPSPDDNSIAVIVKHLRGNMMSRWTNFLTSDGEKEWRLRDDEFELEEAARELLSSWWNEGWDCLFNAIRPLNDEMLSQTILIRNQEHTVQEALNRQLAHYAYHIGQIVLLAKMRAGKEWLALSIPKAGSDAYNAEKFNQKKLGGHYTDDWR
jgi:hypothetical protein